MDLEGKLSWHITLVQHQPGRKQMLSVPLLCHCPALALPLPCPFPAGPLTSLVCLIITVERPCKSETSAESILDVDRIFFGLTLCSS